ncbi:MAG: branched-chain amino acid ABC transporter permease, partial [Shinella sp.]
IKGALVGAVIVGVVDTMGRYLLPSLLALTMPAAQATTIGAAVASMLIYVVMALILAFRPSGLFATQS